MNAKRFRVKAIRFWRKEIKPLLIIAIVLFSIRSSLADWSDVPTGSMKPTIIEGDRIFVNKLAYDLKFPFTTMHIAEWDNPQRGDIVVFFSPHDGKRLVKRVIGLPGDIIEMKDEQLIINGSPVGYAPLNSSISGQLPEAERQKAIFASEQLSTGSHAIMAMPAVQAMRSFGPITVAADQYFMMGDNRDDSFDSRFYGSVERDRIVGRATAVAVSFDWKNFWNPRWKRFFTTLYE